jgi:tetratricopeptide (TPR) repeat protein
MESSVLTARVMRLSGRRAEARALLEGLLAQASPTEQKLKPTWARAQLALGRILGEEGLADRSIALMTSGIAFLSVGDGADAPAVLSAQIELGRMQILKVCDRSSCALAQTRVGFAKINSALQDLTRVLGADHIAVAFALSSRGDMYQITRNDLAALADYQQAAAITDRASPYSRYALNYHLSVAETLVRLTRYDAATLAYHDLAVRLPKTEGMDPISLADYQADLKAGLCGIRQKAPERAPNFRTPAKLDGC